RDGVGGRKNLFALLVEHQVVVPEMRTRHVPVEVLCLQVEREHIGEQPREGGGDLARGVCPEVGRGAKRRLLPLYGRFRVHDRIPFTVARKPPGSRSSFAAARLIRAPKARRGRPCSAWT